MRILSFDCAAKSLGYVLFDIDTKYGQKVLKLCNEDKTASTFISEMFELQHDLFKPVKCGVAELFSENVRKTTEMFHFDKLNDFIKREQFVEMQPDLVLIENQYNNGSATYEIMLYIIAIFRMHNIDISKCSPSRKKKVSFKPHLTNQVFVDAGIAAFKAKKKCEPSKSQMQRIRYNANKKHAMASFEHFIKTLEIKGFTQCYFDLKTGEKSDLADSFLNAYCYCLDNDLYQEAVNV